MKILVYGAGVLGSLYAARLQVAGHEVSILARGQRLADLREHGIVLEDARTGERTTTWINVVETLAPEDAYDLVIVLLRKNQVSAILPVLAANQRTPNVLFMVNNAAGPEEYVQVLDRERVVLGFPGAGGAREGHVIRYAIAGARVQPTTVGELNGWVTPRLQVIVDVLESAGFPVATCANMDARLKTHVALVSPLANALYLAGGDNYRLAKTRDGVVLLVRGVREGLRVLRALEIPITPRKYQVLQWLPEPLLVAWLQRGLATERAELGLARHANAARDEMQKLAEEFRGLARRSGVPTPALDQLYTYLNPVQAPLSEGSAQLRLDWRAIWAGVGTLTGLLLLGGWLVGRRGGRSRRRD